MTTSTASYGIDNLNVPVQKHPHVILKFYDYGCIMGKLTENGTYTEYPVNPADIATTLAEKREEPQFSSGLLQSNTIWVAEKGIQYLVVEWREPQKTAIYLDGTDKPIVVPLPGLLLFRRTKNGGSSYYNIYAVKERPQSLDADLYSAPLPNVQNHGSICWGAVERPTKASCNDLKADWDVLLGSRFGNHSVRDKSKTHKNDIREKYYDLTQKKARLYPLHDLVKAGDKLDQVIDGMLRREYF